MRSHRYTDAVADLRRDLANNPEDMVAVEGMAKALRTAGEYREAISYFERLAAHRKGDETANLMAPGSAGWQIDIACLHWLSGGGAKAIHLTHALAAGILDGSIKYGDPAGGMSQGLLLYYMAITANVPDEVSFTVGYLKNRVNRSFGQIWPRPVALHYLGDISFEAVMEAVNRQPTTSAIADPAKMDLGKRRRLVAALFHDGVRSRARGDEGQCLARMRECYELENPLIEQEWYLARYEVQKADNRAVPAAAPER
jgi:hypothetical protein